MVNLSYYNGFNRLQLKINLFAYFPFFLFFFSFFSSYSQTNKYLIYFTDKNNSPFSISAPQQFLSPRSIARRNKQNIPIAQSDLPVNSWYLDSLRSKGATILYASRWFNAALVNMDSTLLSSVYSLPFVKNDIDVTWLGQGINGICRINRNVEISALNYGGSLTQYSQIGVDVMHGSGYTGKGLLVAVIDDGFSGADMNPIFDSVYARNGVLATWDFPGQEANVYNDDSHGLEVFSTLSAYDSGNLIGGAYEADFLLLRSEVASSEHLYEEVYWLMAAEYADSAGADVINSSLGYSTFDDPSKNQTYAELNGNTTIVTRAAEAAFSTGMLVVNSAGNEGTSSWKYILAPADGPHVLTVGAVDANENYVSFSSQGPSSDGRIKPDVAAMGLGVTIAATNGSVTAGSGTSFSSPLVAGLATGIWQQFPKLTNQQLLDAIRQSGSHFSTPNDYTGYGIPNYSRIVSTISSIQSPVRSNEIRLFPNPVSEEIHIQFPEPSSDVLKVSVSDILGKSVLTEYFQGNTHQVDLLFTSLSPGFYFITLQSSNIKSVLKIRKL